MARGQVENTKIPVNTIILIGRVQRGSSYTSGRRKVIVWDALIRQEQLSAEFQLGVLT